MYSSMTALRLRRGAGLLAPARARERSVRLRVGITWGLLVLNGLTYYGSLVHIPTAAGRVVQQGALQVALLVALTVNRRVTVRPNVFLCLASLLVIGAVISSLPTIHLGSFYRVFRLAEFVAVLWLLTPWWGRRDLLLVRCHLASLYVVLGTVVLGLLVAPGRALSAGYVGTNPAGSNPTAGRLTGVLWYIAPTQVAHYAAVALGMVVILWLCGQTGGRAAMIAAVAAAAILYLTHTRTALVGLVVGILAAWPKPDHRRDQGKQASQVLCGRNRRPGDRHHVVRCHQHLADAGPGHATAIQLHRPDQVLGPSSRVSTRQISGDLWLRPVKQLV